MGSAGKGEFGNYPHFKNSQEKKGTGGFVFGNFEDACPETISLCKLEDICQCDYYVNNNTVPQSGETVYISKTLNSGRISVCIKPNDVIIGNLPSIYNRSILCFQQYDYEGQIENSGLYPIPYILITVKRKQ